MANRKSEQVNGGKNKMRMEKSINLVLLARMELCFSLIEMKRGRDSRLFGGGGGEGFELG
jgi:hypothetical protein